MGDGDKRTEFCYKGEAALNRAASPFLAKCVICKRRYGHLKFFSKRTNSTSGMPLKTVGIMAISL